VEHFLHGISLLINRIIRAVAQGEMVALPRAMQVIKEEKAILASAQCVLNIRRDCDKEQILHSLCDFMKCRRDANAVDIIKEQLMATECGWTAGRLARDSISVLERDLALAMLDELKEDIVASDTEIQTYLVHAGSRRAPRDYQSPWTNLDVNQLHPFLIQLSMWSDVMQFTRNEFADTMHSATKHVHGTSMSRGHYISTLARAINAMMHDIAEQGNNTDDCLKSSLAHARKIVLKSKHTDRIATINSLYDFMRCRCDIDAVTIMSERFLTGHTQQSTSPTAEWVSAVTIQGLSPIERRVVLAMLRLINDGLQADSFHMEALLRLGPGGAAKHA